jgi:RsiW-degrading membrane proteinase PrsW (M82 family)
MSDAALALLLIATSVTLYFLPTIIAALRHKRNTMPIFIVNFAFGWTLIGWIVALAWAFTTDVVDASPSTR